MFQNIENVALELRKFRGFRKDREHLPLTSGDVKAFLSYLAAKLIMHEGQIFIIDKVTKRNEKCHNLSWQGR